MKKDILLKDMKLLVLDCQATGANPNHGHLLEIGWSRVDSTVDPQLPPLETYLVRLPEDCQIPRRVSGITGIKNDDLADAVTPETAWLKLMEEAKQITPQLPETPCPAIIHFARYEEPFLRDLHEKYDLQTPPQNLFPLEILCTYEMARRLLPDLPRKTLRAVAGYLGYSVGEMRRSSDHIEATVFIWRQMLPLLEARGVHYWPELFDWLAAPAPKTPTGVENDKNPFLIEEKVRRQLPKKPGVYRMRRTNGDLLYIGKATSLYQRVNSYFYKSNRKGHARQIMEMLTQAADLDVTVTGSALEAALLETDEIKTHAPPYNVALREREREIAFFSRDFSHMGPKWDEEDCPLGPVATPQAIAPLGLIAELLEKGIQGWHDDDLPALALGSLPEYAPDMETFRLGFELFRERHKQRINRLNFRMVFSRDPISGIMNLGRVFHLARMEALALAAQQAEMENAEKGDSTIEADVDSEGDELQEDLREEWTWTPEAAANALEGTIRRGAHLIRRSRWFCLLSESSLAWKTGTAAGQKRRLLIFRSGGIVHREDFPESKEILIPPGYQRPFDARRRNFDLKTYDRMRVLSTELRRLAQGEKHRQLQLRLSPRAILTGPDLLKGMPWF